MDRADVDTFLSAEGVNLHATGLVTPQGVGIFGVGWSTPTPFGTPSEAGEDRIAAWLDTAHVRQKPGHQEAGGRRQDQGDRRPVRRGLRRGLVVRRASFPKDAACQVGCCSRDFKAARFRAAFFLRP